MTLIKANRPGALKRHAHKEFFEQREEKVRISRQQIQTARTSIAYEVAATEEMLNESMRLAGSVHLT